MKFTPYLLIAAVGSVGVILYGILGFGQIDPPEVAEKGAGNQTLETSTSASDVPLLEKTSDKGIYTVQLRWAQVPADPDGAFDLQIFFLDASQPRGPAGNDTNAESNFTGSGTEDGFTVPAAVENFMPVASYDFSIYSNEGKLLWQALDQPGQGGMPGHHVLLEENYAGPVTIEITNIKPGWEPPTTGEDLTDSVKFAATISRN